jgi:hypothetical protein
MDEKTHLNSYPNAGRPYPSEGHARLAQQSELRAAGKKENIPADAKAAAKIFLVLSARSERFFRIGLSG